MVICDGIKINNLHSHHDFDLCFKQRNISLPEKKSIRETVPFMNGYYDFSALNGAPAWDERSVEYVFDLIAETPRKLDEYASRVLDWLCNAHNVDIFDDTMPDYHWHGSYDGCSLSWDESGLHVEISVEFVVYPFKIANVATTWQMQAGEYTIRNEGMTVAPIVYSDASAAIQIGTHVTSIPANVETKLALDLERGDNTVIITGDGTLQFSYYKEVL